MTPDDIPAELTAMLDDAAGKKHSAAGPVMTTLAAILTRHAEMLKEQEKTIVDENQNLCPGCGEPPAWSGPGTEPGSTVYRCANGHNWTLSGPEGGG